MIVSPRAKPVIDILRTCGNRLIDIDEVFLYRRAKDGGAQEKILYWKRGEENSGVGETGSCCCRHTSGDGGHTPCVIIVEADYDLTASVYNNTVTVLDAQGLPTEEKIRLDHIIEMGANSDE